MDYINFKINGTEHKVGSDIRSDVSLLDYIRNYAELRGTKYMCREGGCGACIVAAAKTTGSTPVSVNSCLVSILSCQDWDITTVEKVGNKLTGYNALQTTLAENNGTQCGYCTPGWIMAMYSLLQDKKELNMIDVEKSLGSNVCRCTGYRPILDAFKKFAKDSPNPVKLNDIEDLSICKKSGDICINKNSCADSDWCVITQEHVKLEDSKVISLKDSRKWYQVHYIADIFNVLLVEGDDSYMLVAGNTAKGVYPISEYPRLLIDISGVSELKGASLDQNLIIGGGTTLSEVLDILERTAKTEYFGYLQTLHDHINLVAHVPVRNLGTIAGNLMIKHQHNEFQSDIFLLLETVGAQLTLMNSLRIRRNVTMQEFLSTSMKSKIIINVLFPPLNAKYKIVSFKIMPRSQSAHAIVNAGYLYKMDPNNKVVQARIVYGGLSSAFIRATATEKLLIGKELFVNATLQSGIESLKQELVVTENHPEPSAAYRKALAINLFYKGLLTLSPSNVLGSRYKSGATRIKENRPVSNGTQTFDTNPTLWPLNQPIQKLEALIQCSGEAPYSEDIPTLPYEVFAAFVLTTVASGTIVSIDATKALKEPGVIAFYSAENIPGENSFTPAGANPFYSVNEELLCKGEVKYFNQPLGIIVAESRSIADRVSKIVEVQYSNIKKPVLDIKESSKDPNRNTTKFTAESQEKGEDTVKVIEGYSAIYGQYHFSMETLVCVTKPIEEGLEVHAATQWMDGIQVMSKRALNMAENKVDVYVRRLGGAFGIKISRSNQVALACNLVALKLNRPCRFIQSLTTNLRAVGKRLPCLTEFEVGVNNSGVIQYVNYNLYEDNGYIANEPLGSFGFDLYYNCYKKARWNYKSIDSITDNASNTFFRSPGTFENIAMAELLMERISYEMQLDPLEVRLANLDDEQYGDIRGMVETLKTNSTYEERRATINKFNTDNRWKKRGLRFSLLRWIPSGSTYLDVNISVYYDDGTIAITHGGIEMGQGINTKAAQIAAYVLKIPLDKIQVKGNNTVIAPNVFITGGSIASQNVGIGVRKACEELLSRLEPVRAQMQNPTWEALVKQAFEMGIDLQAHGHTNQDDIQNYTIFGCALAEVELDVLTGEHEVIKVDLIQDVGQSVSPEIDIGQIEGAFMMGLGYWTCEELVYNPNTGEILTDRTWNYNVPLARDIPQEFNVNFRKKSYSTDPIFGAKATGEPPLCLSVVIPVAMREAIVAARSESGIPSTTWFQIDGPYTVEKICLAMETRTSDLKYN